MPMLFYLPMIVWLGMLEAAQADMRVPAKRSVKPAPARSP
jgi:hypothetical protein